MTLAAGVRLKDYEILSLLGAGGMGEVYLALDTRLKRKVALKLLPARLTQEADRVRRFVQEAQAASALSHPNIITVYDIGESDAGRFIVMELVQGQSLQTLIRDGCAIETIFQLGSQLARALNVAHAAGITHRDIKPENIIVREDGYVKVLDFGLARLSLPQLDKEAATLQGTMPGTLLGTVRYMSPEQTRGEIAGFPSDIFSAGVVLYEMSTGLHPFATDSVLGTLNAISIEIPRLPTRLNPDVPAELERLILLMLEKDPRLRLTASEVETGLLALARSSGDVTLPLGIAMTLPREHVPTLTRRHTVGREKDLKELHACYASAEAGKGVLLCIAGEPGIGKTTVVEEFLDALASQTRSPVIARGRCSERLAGTEAYLPWLEALDGLLRNVERRGNLQTAVFGDESILETTKRLAPTWYTEVMPSQSSESSAERLRAERASSQERMKREFGALLQAVSERLPIVLFLDDLHWADSSTIDLLAYVTNRVTGMRALIIATYRPTDMLLARHPFLKLKPDLQARGLCREIALDFLSREEIEEYLALEFPENRFSNDLPALIHAKTEGNPLFIVDLVHYLRDRGVIAIEAERWTLAQPLPDLERELPESVRGMIQRKIDQLSEDDRRLLVAASVQGYGFDSAVVATVLNLDPADVEERLETLEMVHSLVRFVGEKEFPGNILTLRYRFVHVLYQNALYASLRPTRKAQLSAAVAEAVLAHHSDKAETVASELAFLFEAARDWRRASDNYLIAARNAADVFATQESGALAHRGLTALHHLPETSERAELELKLQVLLGSSTMAAKGFAAPEVEQAFMRASELCLQLDNRAQLFQAQFSLAIVHVVKAEYRRALWYGEQCLELAESLGQAVMLMQSRWILGLSCCYLGQIEIAREHFEQTIAIHDSNNINSPLSLYGGVLSRAHLARMLLYLGYPDRAHQLIDEASAKAEQLGHPIGLANVLALAAYHQAFNGNAQRTEDLAGAINWYAEEHGLPYYAAIAMMMRGWAIAAQGQLEDGIALIRKGLALYEATGTRQQVTYFLLLLVEALKNAGHVDEALETLTEALETAKQTDEQYYMSELLRLKGELLLASAPPGGSSPTHLEAETCYRQSIETARERNARSFELRAVMSLARLQQQQGRHAEAHAMLEEVYDWFTEGFETTDLKEALALLAELAIEKDR
ncbi:MAG: protein kinase [Acidobacteriota bacterium]